MRFDRQRCGGGQQVRLVGAKEIEHSRQHRAVAETRPQAVRRQSGQGEQAVCARRIAEHHASAAALTLIGIFAMRWNVVIGGQLFSKSFLGYTTYKMAFASREGLLPAILLMLLPFGILWVLVRLLPPWPGSAPAHGETSARS